jgi:hypothetical protein
MLRLPPSRMQFHKIAKLLVMTGLPRRRSMADAIVAVGMPVQLMTI